MKGEPLQEREAAEVAADAMESEGMLAEVLAVYRGSNGDATKALYARLAVLGPAGDIAVNLFRASKTSSRAKVYRGSRYKGAAYDTKGWALENLCRVLTIAGAELGIRWGWRVDQIMRGKGDPHHHVLYVDLPTGQVSFHNGVRLVGPDYPGEWDGIGGAVPDRVCRWCARLLEARNG